MRREAGFTLVEMLVALMVFGMLAAAGVMVMRSSVDSQGAVKVRVDRLADFQRLRAVLRADLGQAALRRTRTPEGLSQRIPFVGGEGADAPLLALVRRGWDNPDAAPRASLQYLEYRVVGARLERRVRPYADGAPLGEPQLLYDGVEAAHVAFYAREQWRPAWTETNSLPEAVRLELQLKGIGPVTQLFLIAGAAG